MCQGQLRPTHGAKRTDGPPMTLKQRQICAVFLLIAAAAVSVLPKPLAAQERNLTQVIYDYAVTSYCGTLDGEVEKGFRRELAEQTLRSGLNEAAARKQRIKGWVMADDEWRNRGLGGHKAWCREEGMAASHHFRAIARGDKEP